jgi:hypothetical protein
MKKYIVIYEPKQDCYYINSVNINEIDRKNSYCGMHNFLYHGYICNNEIFDTIEEATKKIKKQYKIKDII